MLSKLLLIVMGIFVIVACVGAIFLNYERQVERYKELG